MTADDMAALLYNTQGYLVLNSMDPLKIGEIVEGFGSHRGPSALPLRVTGTASRLELEAQFKLAAELSPSWQGNAEKIWPYCYRVEAAD